MLGNTRTQGRAILKALSDPSDDLWEDEDEDEEKDYDSGLGSSSGSGSEGRRMAANEIARRKKHLKMSSRLIRRQSRVVDVLGSSKDPFGAMPDAIRGSDLLVYHCESFSLNRMKDCRTFYRPKCMCIQNKH